MDEFNEDPNMEFLSDPKMLTAAYAATFAENLFAVFVAYQEAGFSEAQSFELVLRSLTTDE